ncbi:hypothetical protein DdX_22445 [Ditylenchus destructor]|uniref:Uncharacterized protein n=1 Tax=Ditylenchus destructor TaxID=166010 RepID=A0AAD4MDK8_9BILA|nr:hypothetical protein DdX_22445 [Ditylenchus destructor]
MYGVVQGGRLNDSGNDWQSLPPFTRNPNHAGQKCSVDESKGFFSDPTYYSFSEMLPYLGPTVRIKKTYIYVAGDSTYNPEHIAEMESIAYLWRDGDISVLNVRNDESRIVAEDFQPILNSPTVLQCQNLLLENANFLCKDYKALYTAKVIVIDYCDDGNIDPNYLPDFLEQPGVKPIVAFLYLYRENVVNVLDRLKEDFSASVLPNAFKIVFVQQAEDEPLTEFRETNNTSGEKLELKKGLPVEYQKKYLINFDSYTLERSTV